MALPPVRLPPYGIKNKPPQYNFNYQPCDTGMSQISNRFMECTASAAWQYRDRLYYKYLLPLAYRHSRECRSTEGPKPPPLLLSSPDPDTSPEPPAGPNYLQISKMDWTPNSLINQSINFHHVPRVRRGSLLCFPNPCYRLCQWLWPSTLVWLTNTS